MNQDKTFLGTEPVGKLLLKLSVPTVIAQLVNMLYNIVDRIYIGHMPEDGALALTGVGVCLQHSQHAGLRKALRGDERVHTERELDKNRTDGVDAHIADSAVNRVFARAKSQKQGAVK